MDIQSIFDATVATQPTGEFNFKNHIWGCHKTNPNGIKFIEITTDELEPYDSALWSTTKTIIRKSEEIPSLELMKRIVRLLQTIWKQYINNYCHSIPV